MIAPPSGARRRRRVAPGTARRACPLLARSGGVPGWAASPLARRSPVIPTRSVALALVALASAASAAPPAATEPRAVVLKAARAFDGRGSGVTSPGIVVVRG